MRIRDQREANSFYETSHRTSGTDVLTGETITSDNVEAKFQCNIMFGSGLMKMCAMVVFISVVLKVESKQTMATPPEENASVQPEVTMKTNWLN